MHANMQERMFLNQCDDDGFASMARRKAEADDKRRASDIRAEKERAKQREARHAAFFDEAFAEDTSLFADRRDDLYQPEARPSSPAKLEFPKGFSSPAASGTSFWLSRSSSGVSPFFGLRDFASVGFAISIAHLICVSPYYFVGSCIMLVLACLRGVDHALLVRSTPFF